MIAWNENIKRTNATFQAVAAELLKQEIDVDAVIITTIDETKEDCTASTNIDVDNLLGDDSGWATQEQIKQEMFKKDEKEENSNE